MASASLRLPSVETRRYSPFGAWAAAWFGVAVVLGGCAVPPMEAPRLTAQAAADKFEARSLDEPRLRAYLRENLGRDPTAWDFDTLCWVGFYYHPALDLARAQWAVARAAERTAGQRPNPTLTLAPGYNFTREPGLSPWMPTLGLDWLWQSQKKGSQQVEMLAAEAEAARLSVYTAAWQLRAELRKALLDLHAAELRTKSLEAQVSAQQEVLHLLEQRFAAGSISATEVSNGRGALLRTESAAADATAQAATARARVAAALGLPATALATTVLPVPPSPPALNADALAAARRQSLRSRADVLAALAKYRSAQAALELEVAKRLPDVHLGPSYQWDQGQNKWSLGLSFELPLFHHNEGPIAEAEARRTQAVAEFNVVQAQAIAAIDSAVAAWRAADAQRARAQPLRAEAERLRELARQRKQLGSADALEVAIADVDATTVDTTALEAQVALDAAAGQLEDALQVPFDHLETVTRPGALEHAR